MSRKLLVKSFRSSHQMCSVEKGALKNFAKLTGLIKKETLAQVFSFKFCEIFKNAF